jgi:hypothetical protein
VCLCDLEGVPASTSGKQWTALLTWLASLSLTTALALVQTGQPALALCPPDLGAKVCLVASTHACAGLWSIEHRRSSLFCITTDIKQGLRHPCISIAAEHTDATPCDGMWSANEPCCVIAGRGLGTLPSRLYTTCTLQSSSLLLCVGVVCVGVHFFSCLLGFLSGCLVSLSLLLGTVGVLWPALQLLYSRVLLDTSGSCNT